MTTTDPAILEARELLAEKYERCGFKNSAATCREGAYDSIEVGIIARIRRERPVYSREQELEALQAALKAIAVLPCHAENMLDAYKRHLTALKVDPLHEAICAAWAWRNVKPHQQMTDELRRALAERGLEIREVEG